jgi:hypothetical protein
LRAQRSNPCRSAKKEWIALSRSLSSGAHSRDPVAPRNDGVSELVRCLKTESTNYLRRPGLEPGPICGRPPAGKRWNGVFDRSDCGHMSGLLMRSHMTAAKMGSTARAPNIVAVSGTNGSHGVLPRDCDRSIRSIFRSQASFGLRREAEVSRRSS